MLSCRTHPSTPELLPAPTHGAMYGDGYYNRGKFFETVYGHSDNDGVDVAKFFDGPGNDTFVGTRFYGSLFGAGYLSRASGFAGVGAPRNTPTDIIKMLNKELNAGLADPKIKGRIVELGGTVLGGSPEEFGAILSDAAEKWAKVIKFAGIKVE